MSAINRLGYDQSHEKMEAHRQMEHVFTSAMRYRYEKALDDVIERVEIILNNCITIKYIFLST